MNIEHKCFYFLSALQFVCIDENASFNPPPPFQSIVTNQNQSQNFGSFHCLFFQTLTQTSEMYNELLTKCVCFLYIDKKNFLKKKKKN